LVTASASLQRPHVNGDRPLTEAYDQDAAQRQDNGLVKPKAQSRPSNRFHYRMKQFLGISTALKRFMKPTPLSPVSQRPLHYDHHYLCPVCHHGQIASLTLMDAFACEFCRHIFTANLEAQTIQVADSLQPMSWRWTGTYWQSAYRPQEDMAIATWGLAIAVMVLPTLLIGVSAYIFPPPKNQWLSFSLFWCILTFVLHAGMVGWVIAEYYQFPLYIAGKTRLRQLLNR
jgi:hypothetical protein